MTGPLDSITSAMIGKALDVSLAVHQTIANNIANSDTGGYRPLRLDFDEAMSRVSAVVESGGAAPAIRAALDAVNPVPVEEPTATSVLLDQEMVQLVMNTTHYEALLAARSQLGDIMKLAIKGGRS